MHTEVRVIVTNRGDRCRLRSRFTVAPRQGLALPLQPSFLYAANDPLGCAAQKIKLEFRLKSNHAFSQEHEISTLTQCICPLADFLSRGNKRLCGTGATHRAGVLLNKRLEIPFKRGARN